MFDDSHLAIVLFFVSLTQLSLWMWRCILLKLRLYLFWTIVNTVASSSVWWFESLLQLARLVAKNIPYPWTLIPTK